MKVQAEDLWPLILDFLEDNFSKEDYKAFKKYFKLKVDTSEDSLVKAGGMKAMLASFLKNNKKAYKSFKKQHGKADDSGDEKVSGKKRKRNSSVADSEAEPKKKSKRARAESAVSEASQGPVTRKKSLDAAELKKAHKVMTGPLKRVNEEAMQELSLKMNNNSFEQKGDDSYGGWSNSKLGHIHGASFIKEKNKMKKRNSHASGTFNATTVNSIGFD